MKGCDMKLSCVDGLVPGRSLTEKAKRLAEWGFEGMSVFVNNADWTTQLHDEVVSLRERTGIQPCEFVFMDPVYGHLMDRDRAVARKTLELYKRAIAVCGEIGAVTEMEFEYRTQDPLPLFEARPGIPAPDEAEFMGIMRDLGREARERKARILLEPCNRYETRYLNTLRACSRLIERSGAEGMGILADFFHMSIEEPDLPASIREAGPAIVHVHLGDSNRMLPGLGHTDWPACLRALADVGYAGYLSLECCVGADAAAGLPAAARRLCDLIAVAASAGVKGGRA
jgi:sugar phosphate isomerase/epimerase